ncbi:MULTISPECIES: TIGR04086 family membrane protein [Shouchella]|uniref:TIGR04086 family membrane protein n=2 Tax=Shouchella TaxID=2893057 RepID=A0ABY7W830_9BACI|nr:MULTISPECIES: TIGR04086 family membrane protein [Shouchella]MED4130061.1 TIGR04086 family membrane protein [Shouchella miscanthi]WDF02865.1 TIGR04086 family membrane protein [Shouchella hunanensis]GAF24508.1 hypothetical protein JCM19047_4414 [Bacillus sp. JCM 19047]
MVHRFFPAIFIGLSFALGIAIVSAAIIATLLSLTSLTEQSVGWLMIAIAFLALFVGGFISGGKARTKGWLAGSLCAIFFCLLATAISYLGYNEALTVKQMILFAAYCGIAALGGVIGVNLSPDES